MIVFKANSNSKYEFNMYAKIEIIQFLFCISYMRVCISFLGTKEMFHRTNLGVLWQNIWGNRGNSDRLCF